MSNNDDFLRGLKSFIEEPKCTFGYITVEIRCQTAGAAGSMVIVSLLHSCVSKNSCFI